MKIIILILPLKYRHKEKQDLIKQLRDEFVANITLIVYSETVVIKISDNMPAAN